MKRNWYSWMAAAVSLFVISPLMAQSGQIGSYQSILSRAGYSNQQEMVPNSPAPAVPSQGNGQYQAHQAPAPQYAPMHAQSGAAVPGFQNGCGPVSAGPMGPAGGQMAGGVGCNPAPNSYVDNGCAGNAVYAPGQAIGCGPSAGGGNFLGGVIGNAGGANRVVSLFGLFFERDYEDDLPLSSNGAGDYLFSTDADNGTIGGYGIDLARRNCDGRGVGLRYWGLDSSNSQAMISPYPLMTDVNGFMDVDLAGYMLDDIFNYGATHVVERETEIHNVELNLLKNGGAYTTRRGRAANFELFGGFRWLEFDERFRYTTCRDYGAGVPAGVPDKAYLDLNTSNTLLGMQLGGRSEICLTNRLSFAGGTRLGVFNNYIEARQNAREEMGPFATINGTNYNFESEKNDVAFIGELDAGLIYQLSQKARLNFGYRAISVAGVALAVDQFPNNFTNINEINRIKSNGDLLLHGGYAGLEWCY